MTVNFKTEDFDAFAGEDYIQITSGTLTFAPGETSKNINVAVNGDTKFESDETFLVTLTSAIDAVIEVGGNFAIGTIVNDDPANPTVVISQTETSRVAEGDSGTTNAGFTVTLSAPSARIVTVFYTTEDFDAIGGEDYVPITSGTFFAAGETSKNINVAVNGDTTFESDETFLVTLTSAIDADIE